MVEHLLNTACKNSEISFWRCSAQLFCATRTAVDNPMMQPSGMAQRRSFLVLEEGEIDGTTGYWAETKMMEQKVFLKLRQKLHHPHPAPDPAPPCNMILGNMSTQYMLLLLNSCTVNSIRNVWLK